MTSLSRELRSARERGEDRDVVFSRFYRDAFARHVVKCIMIGVSAADAPGIVQEVMLEIYHRWPKIGSPQAYANFAVPRRAAGFLELSSWVQPMDDADLARLMQPLTARLPEGVLAIGGEELVLEALDQLPPTQRAVFALVYDDYKCVEIGKILELKEDTVRSHLRHARAVLRLWWTGRIQGEEVDPCGAR
jgi:DNA-directed RNA polymerase specialized sigma24 family protein